MWSSRTFLTGLIVAVGSWPSASVWADPVVLPPSPTPHQDYHAPSQGTLVAPTSIGTVIGGPQVPYGYRGYAQPTWAANGYTTPGAGPGAGAGPYWAPGGYEPRIGSPYNYHDPNPQGGQYVVTGDPYYDHWGPGFHRHSLHGHYRFPYSTYRAPWYYPGRAVYNRDTNLPW
jgi:hypothetical protein